MFNLEMIPQTIDNINQNLLRVTGYMIESYDVEEKDLPLLKGTQFSVFR